MKSVKPCLKFTEGSQELIPQKMHPFNAALITALESVIEEEEETIEESSDKDESVNGMTGRSHSS